MQGSRVLQIPVEQIRPSPFQPRTRFDESSLDALADSMRAQGVIEPLVVRRASSEGLVAYEIIAGERRWRAAQRLRWAEVPCVVKHLGDADAAAATLVENLQREDLGPLEVARAVARLRDDLGLDQRTIGEKIGYSQSSVAHHLRLLTLPDAVQLFIDEGVLNLGHAKALLAAPEYMREQLARRAVRTRCSVRQLERWAKAAKADKRTSATDLRRPAWLRDEEDRMAQTVGSRVEIHHDQQSGRGTVTLHYSSLEEYDGLKERLIGREVAWD